ncbi:hypothetical protein [Methylophilus medardicus]|uniref:DUF11 domain-containing protein n=1 Tax=Methylophilus medardicus TaxID=2588534 RepID=A0A5B8CSK3_9PROT|nr:hypothetical protein [Methylophilus medardicus]QDC44267.1 hypothetical protein FIU01_06850 [Methylophilus medardicus]QDC49274.1 hypothetical protein FIU00_06850 [Methylophilus medardicus]QDC52979.1 hypothetical protein FIT99_06850 [Methylophilus medardicus]
MQKNNTLIYRRVTALLLLFIILLKSLPLAYANLRTPTWWDQNAVNTTPDWHYRVPINIPSGTPVNSTIKVDVDFASLLSSLGVSGTFDVNSPRVVRSTGTLSTNQEFTDAVFAGATNATGDSRGEVRFILQDAGPTTYYLYFDITANGSKPTNPQVPINGNFEIGSTGNTTPLGWTRTTSNASLDGQIRPNETVSVTASPAAIAGPSTVNANGNAFSGQFSYLMGLRTNVSAAGNVVLNKTVTIPASSAGNFSLRWKPQGWDANSFDTLNVQIIGTTTRNVVGPTSTIAAYAAAPNSANFGAGLATATTPGYRFYNGFDCGTNLVHTAGMTVTCGTDNWFSASTSLSAFAGQTVTVRITYNGDTNDKTWFSVDDVEWSVVNATLGVAEGFGGNITNPTSGSFTTGSVISITAQVNAQPTASGNPVTANIYDAAGTLVASGIILYNNATNGDTTANDSLWTNSNAYTIPASGLVSGNWTIRVFARDASTSTIGATNGLIRIPSLPNTPLNQANYYNIDDQIITVTITTPLMTNLKTVTVLNDPVNGTTNPKMIPGAVVEYTIRITNSGNGTVDNNSIVITDPIPVNGTLFTGNVSGGAPYQFTNGSPSSGITCPFTALGNLTDCVDFSNDGGATWTYVPNGSYDSAVRHLRFKTTGAMAANTGTGNPFFEIKFNVQIQ